MPLEVRCRRPARGTEAQSPPLVFVHGMWHGAWCWDEYFMPFLAERGYTSYAVSLRGHGQSDMQGSLRFVRLRDYVEDVRSLAAGLEEAPIFVGHSMGGYIVQRYLERYPARGAVLLASVPPGGILGATLRTAARAPLAWLQANLMLDPYYIVSTPARCRQALFGESLDEAAARKSFSLLNHESYAAYLDMLLPIRAGNTKTPLLVLGAGDDALISPAEVRSTAVHYEAECEMFPDMPHDMMIVPGWEAVALRMLPFLQRFSAGGAKRG